METLALFDYTAIVIYLALMAGIGIFFGWFIKDIKDYFKGGSTIPWPVAGVSNFMTLFSTSVFVAYAGIAYEHGLVSVMVIWCTVPSSLLAAFVFSKIWRRSGIMSPVEFLETRFNSSVRQILSWGGILFRILDNMVRLYAIGIFLTAATPISLETAILIAGLLILAYMVIGGLWAVVVLDAVQFVVLILTTLILVPLSIQAVGGFSSMADQIPDHFDFFNGPKGAPLFLIVYYLMFTLKWNGNWAFIQRFYSVRDEKESRKLGLLTAGLFMVFPAIFLIPSMAARVLIPDLPDKEMAYVAMSVRLLPPGIMGLMLASMFSATMSSLNSEYNVMASVLTRDVYNRLINPKATDKQLMWVARISTVVVGILIMIGALFVGGFGGAFEANKLFTGLFAIPMVVPLVFGVILRKAKPMGAIMTLVVGIIVGLILNAHPEISWELGTLIEIIICVGIMVLSGFWPAKNAAYQQRVDEFFARISRPLDESEKPTPKPAFKKALYFLFAIAIACAGLLFIVMAIPSLHFSSGIVAMISGFICLLLATYLFTRGRKIRSAEFEQMKQLS